MNNHQTETIKWTWADLISSYRFWGILFFFILVMLADTNYSIFLPRTLTHDLNFRAYDVGVIVSLKFAGMMAGFVAAWLASRSKKVYPLYLFGVLFLLALALMSYGTLQSISVGSFLIGFSSGAILLFVPAIFASAVASIEVFVLSFGLMSLLKQAGTGLAPMFVGLSQYLMTDLNDLLLSLGALVALGMVALLPVKQCLFSEAPAKRIVTPFEPTFRMPIGTFFLCFIPFYFIYWFANVHREIRTFSQSPSLLTPAGAGWSVTLVPFAMPIILSILSDHINGIQQEKGHNPGCKTWVVIVLSLIFLPLSLAIVQSKLNQLTLDME